MEQPLEFLIEREEQKTRLLSPGVGLFTCCLPAGRVLVPGQPAGTLSTLGVLRTLIVPAGCSGKIVGERPELVHEPVAFGTRLYELEPMEEEQATETEAARVDSETGMVVSSPHTGRFWLRPSPSDSAFVQEGDVVQEGTVLGLIEVMKTFTHVHYRAAGGLPASARVVRILVEDGTETMEGTALIEVESA